MVDIIVTLLTLFTVVIAVLLIGLILVQRSKSGGGLGALSGGAAEEVFGSGTGDVLVRATVVLAILFGVSIMALFVLQEYARKVSDTSAAEGAPSAAALPEAGDLTPGEPPPPPGADEASPDAPPAVPETPATVQDEGDAADAPEGGAAQEAPPPDAAKKDAPAAE